MEIKLIRESTGLSQQKFADKFGIPVTNIQKWEQGIHKPLNYVVSMIQTILDLEKENENLRNGTNKE
jgi:DNA-binding transcriptional regulator YiaG